MYALRSARLGLQKSRELNKSGIPSQQDKNQYSHSKTDCNPVNRSVKLDGKAKNTVRVIRNLRDDLARAYPKEPMPSTWMIKCLVISSDLSHSFFDAWDNCILGIMQYLADNTENAFDIKRVFFELDGNTPLFPNPELYEPKHVNRFAKLAISHLKMQLGKDGDSCMIRATR